MSPKVTRRFLELSHGVVHCACAGEGDAVLLLHQTPRSWDEFRDVLPLLGRDRRAIALDTPGFGDSAPLPRGSESIEAWAGVAAQLLDALEIPRADVVGHHTGATIAIELAASRPERVRSLVLSSAPFAPPEVRAKHARGRAVVDDVARSADGAHLLELWRVRAGFYPPGQIELLERFMIDALRAGPLAAEGHRVVARYEVEQAVARVRCPVLLIGASADPFAYPNLARLRAALPQAAVEVIEGGTVALPDQLPREFGDTVQRFLGARR